MLSVARAAFRRGNIRSPPRFASLCFARSMSETSTPKSEGPAQRNGVNQKPKPPKKEVKVLMLHGYTQSGPLFHAKTRALEKLLTKLLDPNSTTLTLHYPTGPIRLSPSDIPGFVPSTTPSPSTDPSEDEIESYAWFRRNRDDPTVRGLDVGMAAVTDAIKEAGGVDGVMGFSQGGALAALVASTLEHRTPSADHTPWSSALREANNGKPLRFAVIYSGFFLPVDELRWAYEPSLRTPSLHFLGSLDTVVDEGRSRGLVERWEGAEVVVHPGGHHVPIARQWVLPTAGFMKRFADEMEAKI